MKFISSQINSLLQAFDISKKKAVQTTIKTVGTTDDGRITGKTGDIYSVDVKGVTYKIKSNFDFSINERVLISTPFGGAEKYLYPNKMGTTGEVVVDAYTKLEVDTFLAGKVDTQSGKGLSTNDYTTAEKDKLFGIAENANNYVHPSTHPASMITETTTKKFVSDSQIATWNTVTNKVDMVEGKGLSTNDYTTIEKNKLTGIANNATANDTDANLKNRVNHTGTQSADTITDGTTNKVLTSTLKTQYDTAYTNNHTHSNKTDLDLVSGTNTGDETVISIGGIVNGATEKTTPVDADMTVLMDSASSNVLKKLSWSNVKSTLKSYFDTLYNNYSHPTQTPITSDNSNGVVIQDISVDNLGHTTSVATYDLDNRYYTEAEVDTKFAALPTGTTISKTFTIPATVGWYRIAQSPIDTKQASGIVEITWNSLNGYEGHELASVSSWGNYTAVITQLLCSSSYSNPYVYQMRVVRPSSASTTGNRAYLEIYLLYPYQTEVKVDIGNNIGWEFLDLDVGSIPSGWTYELLTFYRYMPISTSSTSTCSGLNATYLQGYSSGSFQRQYNTTSSLPTPSSSYRNMFYWLNVTGNDDKCYMGERKADGSSYVFKEIASTDYVDNAIASIPSSGGGDYDTTTTWNTDETIYTTTWTDGTKNYSSVVTELSDTQYRKQMYVDGVLTEQWDITENSSSITTDYTKFT